MTDKQQIEKFAKDLCKACRESLKTCECKTPCVKAQIVSEALYNARYRKVPENAVVVDKEYLKKELQGLELQARKETAKEILQWLVNTGVINTAPNTTKMYFKEHFGVEVE